MAKNYAYYSHDKLNDLRELLEKNYKTNKDGIAFIYKDSSLNTISKTYENFYEEVTNLSNYLFNSYNNKHIAIIAENSYSWVVLFYAIIISGNVAVVIDKDLEPERIEKLLNISDTEDIFCTLMILIFILIKAKS